jgi:hypothetical protein
MQQKSASDEGEEGCNMPVCKRFWRAGLKAPFSLSQSYLRSDTGCSLAARLQFLQHSAGTAAQPVEGRRAFQFSLSAPRPLTRQDQSMSAPAPSPIFHVVNWAHHAL